MQVETFSDRTEILLGRNALNALASAKIAIFGLGGVGGWCAESLARTGAERMTLVDPDDVCVTNVNRQTAATTKTIGRPKAEALAERLVDINPSLVADVRCTRYCAETAQEFDLSAFDYVIDAIDSLDDKTLLVRNALACPETTLFSSMGAAFKTDPLQVRASEFRKVEGDGLARALRQRFKKSGGIPARRFTCVWSQERRAVAGPARPCGSIVHTTAVFGLALASLVVADIIDRHSARST